LVHPFHLGADVFAGLPQFQTNQKQRISPDSKFLPFEIAVLAANFQTTATALFPFGKPITEATACFGGIPIYPHKHDPRLNNRGLNPDLPGFFIDN
jgi:hypothetical protein